MKQIKDISTAIELFKQAAIAHGVATEQGRYMAGNNAHDKLKIAMEFINGQGETLKLMPLLSHTDQAVRVWAATFLLPICEKEAIDTLSNASHQPGIIALGAQTTLEEWRKGNLHL